MSRPDVKLQFDTAWKYAPAPESTDHVRIDPQYELYIDGEFVRAVANGSTSTRSTPRARRSWRASRRRMPADIDRAVAAARHAYDADLVEAASRRSAASTSTASRALLQERAREFAAIESLDGGKPIRESRDVDVPLAAAHFFYYAGWADKLEYAFPGRRASAIRRRWSDHSLEFSAAHGGVEDCAGTGVWQHGGAEARRNDAAHRAQAR